MKNFKFAQRQAFCRHVRMTGDAQRFVLDPFQSLVHFCEHAGGVVRQQADVVDISAQIASAGQTVGQTAAKTFIYKEVPPGKHVITSSAENTDTLEIDAKPGTLAFIWQEVKMGLLYSRTKLTLVSEEEGKRGVSQSQLATGP